jgi:hypothetical protein
MKNERELELWEANNDPTRISTIVMVMEMMMP